MREGTEKEELIITQYKDKMQAEGHAGLEVNSCGFLYQRLDFWELHQIALLLTQAVRILQD